MAPSFCLCLSATQAVPAAFCSSPFPCLASPVQGSNRGQRIVTPTRVFPPISLGLQDLHYMYESEQREAQGARKGQGLRRDLQLNISIDTFDTHLRIPV